MAETLDIGVLGPIEAVYGNRPVHVGGPKQRALLAQLAMATPTPVPAELLADDGSYGTARDPVHALQTRISRLRECLPIDVDHAAGGYRLDPERLTTDADRFKEHCRLGRQLLTAGDGAAAAEKFEYGLGLWRGQVLADVAELIKSSRLRPDIVHLEHLRDSAQVDRIEAHLAAGNAAAIIPDLYRLVEVDPLRERNWVLLMTALSQQGFRTEALAAYQRARTSLIDELGYEPGQQLAGLHQQLLQEEAPETAATQSASGRPGAWLAAQPAHTTLVGRARELEVLRSGWEQAQHRLAVVTITGEAGIGKTRLAAELSDHVASTGAPVLQGRCDEAVDIAHGPIAQLLTADVKQLDSSTVAQRLGPHPGDLLRIAPELAALFPEHSNQAPAAGGQPDVHRLRQAVAGWLVAASGLGPMLLVIDDLQWSGTDTMHVLDHLIHSAAHARALIVFTHRDHHDPDDHERFLSALRQSDTVTHLPLERLDEDQTTNLLAAELRNVHAETWVRAPLADYVRAASGGNPLFVLELSRHLSSLPGSLASQPDGWPEGAIPAGLRGVVEQRLSRLPQASREVFQYAAIIGTEFDPWLLAQVSSRTQDDLDEILAGAIYARLIDVTAGHQYAFCHGIVRTVLYESVPPLRRRRLHLQVAQALQDQHAGQRPDGIYALAHHYYQAGSYAPAGPAVWYLQRAGEVASDQYACAQAVEFYQRALAIADDDGQLQCDLLIGLGSAQFRNADPTYRRTLLRAGQMAHALGDAQRLTAAAVANSRGWYASTIDVDWDQVSLVENALAVCDPDDNAARARLLTAWAVENIRDPDQRTRALTRSSQALELARRTGDGRLLGEALSGRYAVVYAAFADPDECVRLSEELLHLARRQADPGLELSAVLEQAQAHLMIGSVSQADRALDRAIELARTLNEPARLWMAQCWQAMRAGMMGQAEAALTRAQRAYEFGTQIDQPDAFTWFAGQVFTLHLYAGTTASLIDEVGEQVLQYATGIPAWKAAYAVVLADAGRLAEAQEILDSFAADNFTGLPLDMLWLAGMAYLSQVAQRLQDTQAGASLYHALRPYSGLLANNGTIDAGPVDLHLAVLAELVGRPDHAQEHLREAIGLCRRIEAPVWLSWAERVAVELP